MNVILMHRIVNNVVAVVMLAASSAVCAAQNGESMRVAQVFAEARSHAALAAINADQLETYHMANIPWQVHYYRLLQIGDYVNALTKDVQRLNRLRAEASPKQTEAILQFEQLQGILQARVINTRKYLVKNHQEVNMPTFHNQVKQQDAAIRQVSASLCLCLKSEYDRLLSSQLDPPSAPRLSKPVEPDCPPGD